ncbi:MAG TPA: LysM peptidoglycan-binding domain-containing protein [Puia sp.]|nr:LysM peptidoglycan-binding domain-containing protein [Puia sp.]
MRSSATVLILISCFFAKFARSQSHELIIQGVTGKLYLEHTVVPKENWYSVGRLYNVNPKELAPFNHLTLAKPLIIGQILQIPLTATNFSQNDGRPAGETLIPVIHITREKEWMYRISVDHNKVPIPDIEKWNHVTPDQIHPGMHLIVGYLKVRTALSALATNAPAEPAVTEPATYAPATSTQPAAVMPKPAGPPPTTSAPATSAPTTATPGTSAPATSAPPPPAPVVSTTPTSPAPHFDGGNFRSDYNESGKSASGQAGIFKSTSGWQDGKYYALMNNVTVGTIVRITDPTTNKTVYAKILGQLPDMKESAGLAIRMSNAAAAELGETDSRFAVQISY